MKKIRVYKKITMKIKMCGNRDLSQLKELENVGIDYAGLIFYQQSPRYVLKKISGKDVRDLNLSIPKVGVFVNASEEEIMQQVEDFGLDMVQLHGDETAPFCTRISDQIKVIKAFRISDFDSNVDWLVKEYDEACDYYLFDKANAGLYGGTGEKFNWNLLENSVIGKPFFLSGGISIDDAAALKSFHHAFFYGIDVNSKFEKEPGVKDMKLIKEFVSDLKK
ncbi:MAG: phosphoribosylanthranilate isomerase [Ginsengibacter sp.]